jgi:cytochrome c
MSFHDGKTEGLMKSLGNRNHTGAAIVAIIGIAAGAARAQGSWPGCDPVSDQQIKTTPIVSRSAHAAEEPMKMAFDLVAAPGEDAKDKVDVYFTERKGNLRRFDALQNRVVTLGRLNMQIAGTSSDGLLGIALDPGFKANRWVYLYYSRSGTGGTSWRISRFTLNAARDQMDLNSEKVILDVPMQSGSQHTGGALQFDAYGALWITTGDNHLPGGSGFYVHTSANTNDLRAKILRIKPIAIAEGQNPAPGVGSTYTIPEGNLFPPGTERTRPEIYVMGTRNPYTLSLDPVRRWAAFGDIGPDDKNMDGGPLNQAGSADLTEEYNLATEPGNYGYPFFAGDNFALKSGIDASAPAIPAGTSWNGAEPGLATLPAAVPAIKAYRRSCAVAGPIYRYDGDLNSSVKFPPHFHRKWIVSDFNATQKNIINLLSLSEDGKRVTGQQTVLNSVVLYGPLDMQFGPDGALYVSNYSGYRTATSTTGIVRIEYTGGCRPAEPKLENPVGILAGGGVAPGRGPRLEIRRGAGLSVAVGTPGAFRLRVLDILGRPVAVREGEGDTVLPLEGIGKPGVYFLEAVAPEGKVVRRIAVD